MPWYRHLLWPFAAVYGFSVWVRNRLFDAGLLSSKEFDVPVICVGNLEAGGTGKSPVVLYIIQLFLKNGVNVAMLSRGYGRVTKGFRLVSTTDVSTDVGDEPLQAKLRFPQATVAVCENRAKGIQRLLDSKNRPDVIVMDDGFQHRWVKPSMSLLVTRSAFPFWKNQLLPVGTLRESKSEMNRADAIVTTGSETDIPGLGMRVFQSSTRSELPIVLNTDLAKPVKSVVLLSGIANSHRFEDTAKSHFEVLDHLKFKDHHSYSVSDMELLQKKIDSFGASADAVLTTEKDAARLTNSPLLEKIKGTPLFYLPIDVMFSEKDKNEFDKMILRYGKYA